MVYVNAAGDSGAPVGYPGASPDVVAVGGTTLTLNSQNNISSETGWSGSGGGISADEPQPSYQQGVVTQSTTRRTNPDVAYDANPSTGVPVYDSYDTSTPWGQWGGTSIAAPQWSALFAIADQARAAAGAGPLSSTQALSLLYATYSTPSYSSDFHDITSGTSTGNPHYSAGPGYDLVTGLGTPIANQLVNVLGGQTSTSTVTHFGITATSTSTAGSSFSITVTALNSSNDTVTGYNGTVQFTSTDGQAVLPGNSALTAGVGTFSVTLKTAGSQTIQATDAANGALTGSATVSVSPAAASKLAFLQQPTNVMVGATISPAVTVAIEDAYSNVVTSDNSDSVTMAIGPNSGSGTLGGTTTGVPVSGGVATFSNLTISSVRRLHSGRQSSLNSAPASATSTSFNVTTASPQPADTIEGFESGNLSAYTLLGSAPAPFSVSTAAEHNGTYGLVASGGNDWIYRDDPAVQVQPGETLSVWLQFQGSASGAAYFGFASSSARTLSFVVSPATNQLLIELNASSTMVLGSTRTSSSIWKANSWYRLEVDWGTNDAIVGKLYDSSGTNLLASLTSAYTVTGSGGIAFAATGSGSKYFDTVQMVPAGTAIPNLALPSLTESALVPGSASGAHVSSRCVDVPNDSHLGPRQHTCGPAGGGRRRAGRHLLTVGPRPGAIDGGQSRYQSSARLPVGRSRAGTPGPTAGPSIAGSRTPHRVPRLGVRGSPIAGPAPALHAGHRDVSAAPGPRRGDPDRPALTLAVVGQRDHGLRGWRGPVGPAHRPRVATGRGRGGVGPGPLGPRIDAHGGSRSRALECLGSLLPACGPPAIPVAPRPGPAEYRARRRALRCVKLSKLYRIVREDHSVILADILGASCTMAGVPGDRRC